MIIRTKIRVRPIKQMNLSWAWSRIKREQNYKRLAANTTGYSSERTKFLF